MTWGWTGVRDTPTVTDEVRWAIRWAAWFQSYTAFILHAARLAEEEGAEMLCIGCEMVRADGQDARWRSLITAVREVYSGLVPYNCDTFQEDHVTWWDAVDVITSSGYCPIGSWDEQLNCIETVVTAAGRPFFFMEAGCPSRTGSPAKPNDWALPGVPSGAEQLHYCEDMFAATGRREWMRGFMLWDWPTTLYAAADAAQNDDDCVCGKPAADFLGREYASRMAAPTTAPPTTTTPPARTDHP
nr:hypothetical protein [Cryobacterium adonitolivorans]